jgi:hypothetical protein
LSSSSTGERNGRQVILQSAAFDKRQSQLKQSGNKAMGHGKYDISAAISESSLLSFFEALLSASLLSATKFSSSSAAANQLKVCTPASGLSKQLSYTRAHPFALCLSECFSALDTNGDGLLSRGDFVRDTVDKPYTVPNTQDFRYSAESKESYSGDLLQINNDAYFSSSRGSLSSKKEGFKGDCFKNEEERLEFKLLLSANSDVTDGQRQAEAVLLKLVLHTSDILSETPSTSLLLLLMYHWDLQALVNDWAGNQTLVRRLAGLPPKGQPLLLDWMKVLAFNDYTSKNPILSSNTLSAYLQVDDVEYGFRRIPHVFILQIDKFRQDNDLDNVFLLKIGTQKVDP